LAHLYELRATVDAVMCGARTIEAGAVHLGPGGVRYQRRRLRAGLSEFNLRVVVSGSGSVAPKAYVFAKRISPIIVLTTARAGQRRLAALARVADEVVICGDGAIDFAAALRWLAARWQVKRLLCEGGGELNAAMFAANLVHELHLTVSPFVFGGCEAPTIARGIGAKTLGEATQLRLQRVRRVGDELFCVFEVLPASSPSDSQA
jgi:riboflavin-specific deaminase-like protein